MDATGATPGLDTDDRGAVIFLDDEVETVWQTGLDGGGLGIMKVSHALTSVGPAATTAE